MMSPWEAIGLKPRKTWWVEYEGEIYEFSIAPLRRPPRVIGQRRWIPWDVWKPE